MNVLDELTGKYRLILCDIWGVVHDGVTLYPGAAERLLGWRRDGCCVALVTNAPRTPEAVEAQLASIGLPREAYHFVATSGEAGIAALKALAMPVGFLGTAGDRAILEGRGVMIATDDVFADLACTGLTQERPTPEDYWDDLRRWAGRGVKMHCLNPDRLVIRGGVPEPCAGALADMYESLGGRVTWYGKPHPAIYRHTLDRAGNPPPTDVVAVGDGLHTDILGAARMGFDAVFVTGGIHAGMPFPADFASENGLGEWKPIGVVDGLL